MTSSCQTILANALIFSAKIGEHALSPQNLCHAILLRQETLLANFVQKTRLAIPTCNGLQEGATFRLWSDITHLNNDERSFPSRAGGQKDICIELARRSLDAVTEMLYQGCCCSRIEITAKVTIEVLPLEPRQNKRLTRLDSLRKQLELGMQWLCSG